MVGMRMQKRLLELFLHEKNSNRFNEWLLLQRAPLLDSRKESVET